MFTLIIREIEDSRVFFIAAATLAAVFSVFFVYGQFYDDDTYKFLIGVGIFFIPIPLAMTFSAMGASQMYWDKTKKISALLATLAVTRRHIFVARVIAGLLLVLIGFVPVAEAISMIFSKIYMPSPSVRSGLSFEVMVPSLLLGFACYCVGLQAGWTSNKVAPTLSALGLSVVLIPVILIKGFGWEIYAVLVLLISACLIRAWYRFSTAAL